MRYLTSDVPGIGGTLKATPEDFRVEEVPLYNPSGEGAHLLLRIEKRGMTTHEAVQKVAKALRLPDRDVGFAGIKDSRAVATQWLSVPASCEGRLAALDHPWLKIREATRNSSRLRVGDLAGNRFEIALRDVVARDALERARAIVATLVRRGVPNWFGAQRFGTKNDNDLLGRAIVRQELDEALAYYLGRPSPLENDPRIRHARQLFDEGRLDEAERVFPVRLRMEASVLHAYREHHDAFRALLRIPKRLRLLFVSAYQSRLFNRCLEARFESLDRVQDGDVIVRHETDRPYTVTDVAHDQPRADAFEISPAGPLFGPGLPRTRGRAAAIEEAVFAAEGLDLEHRTQAFPDLHLRGERRAYRFPIRGATVDPLDSDPHALVLRFELPRGCYATCVLAEVMKSDAAPAEETPTEDPASNETSEL